MVSSFACSLQSLGKHRQIKLRLGYLPPNLVLILVGEGQQIVRQKDLKARPRDLIFGGELVKPGLGK